MAVFTESEFQYLRGQRLACLATADSRGHRSGAPRFRVASHGAAIEVGGRSFGRTKKYRDMKANPKVAKVFDDIVSIDPSTPRGVEIRGIAELQPPGAGPVGPEEPWARIRLDRIVSWGISS